MALRTFLKRRWSCAALQQLPPAFLTAVLLPAVASPIHHRSTFQSNFDRSNAPSGVDTRARKQQPGAAGDIDLEDTSEADAAAGFTITGAATQLLSRWLSAAAPQQQREVVEGALGLLAGGDTLSRPGLLCLLRVLAGAAPAAGPRLLEGCGDPGE